MGPVGSNTWSQSQFSRSRGGFRVGKQNRIQSILSLQKAINLDRGM